MKRRSFLKGSAVAGVTTLCGAGCQSVPNGRMPKLEAPKEPAQLNLCLQWGKIPGSEI
ncbi:MAG: twin-arginine translocation signal domain-containing protein, partial [Planctomycetes bacterium]|nr:twin-arginine translocation signal domain-containing protein [Planctomycetota bacterium]